MWILTNSSRSKPLVASLLILLAGPHNANGQLCNLLPAILGGVTCGCIAGECGIIGALIGNAGEGCNTAADCVCQSGVCRSKLTRSPTKKPTPNPSPSPSTSLVPSTSSQPSDGGGGGVLNPILGTALCTDLLDPLNILGLTVGCLCLNLGLTSGCANSIDLLGNVAEVCLLDDDCACNEVTGQCESTVAPNPTPTTPTSPTLLPPVLGLALCTDLLDPLDLLGLEIGCTCVSVLGVGTGCGNPVDLIPDLAEVCVLNSDCQCNAATGKCESLLTTAPSVSSSPSV
ncbi:hypothetical protein ACHAXS_000930, partial [Conticribra weissflogii]